MDSDREHIEVMIPDVDGWAIVKYTWDGGMGSESSVEVYAEHVNGCNRTIDLRIRYLCWQADDTVLGKANLCWKCMKPVPDSVVGLVALAEWR